MNEEIKSTVLKLKPNYENIDKMESKSIKEKIELTALELLDIPFDQLPMDTDERKYVQKCVEFKMKSYWSKPVKMRSSNVLLQISWDGKFAKLPGGKIKQAGKPTLDGKPNYPALHVIISANERYHQSWHTLVADAWLPNNDNSLEINHIDGNKWNCSPWNLEWISKSENMQHALRTGLKNKSPNMKNVRKGEKHPFAKCTELQVREICELLQNPKLSCHDIATKTNVTDTMVYHILDYEAWVDISKQYPKFPKRIIASRMNGEDSPLAKYTDKIELIMDELDKKALGRSNKSLKLISEELNVPVGVVEKISAGHRWLDKAKDHIFYKMKFKNKEGD